MSDVVREPRCAAERGRRLTPSRRRFGLRAAVPALVALMTLAACTSATNGASTPSTGAGGGRATGDGSSSTAPSARPAEPAAVITTSPVAGTSVSPVRPVTVAVTHGKLTSVELLNPQGKHVTGALAAGGASWRSTEDLGYSKTYRLSAVAVSADGRPATRKTQFTTLTPANMTMPSLATTGGDSLQNGATYGVGIVPVVHFDEAIADKPAAEKALVVRTSPHVRGVWNWISDTEAHWRPQGFYQPGTHVTVSANVYGVRVGPGLYGQADQSVSFKIGAKHVSIADDVTHLVKVYFNNKLVRTMPTSMGQGGYVSGIGGQQISLWTMPGTYTVIAHHDPVLMDSSTFGLPVKSAKGYKEYIYQATQISTDGIYLHQLDSTVWAQGHLDLSHGCLNLSYDNAHFFYTTSQVGDVVQVIHTGGPKLQLWQNGDWSVPWTTWVKGSAVH